MHHIFSKKKQTEVNDVDVADFFVFSANLNASDSQHQQLQQLSKISL
jgi:mannitol/fructose-specific phosphotransferase system IIA component (Ntr-type)